MNSLTIPIIILIVTIVASRMMGERALKQLSIEEKGILLDSFSSYRTFNTVVSLAVVVAYFVAADYVWQRSATLALIFIGLFFAISATISVLSYRKLKGLDMPESYVRSFLIRLELQYAGLAVVFVPIARQAIQTQR